jgi:hypothetical protein
MKQGIMDMLSDPGQRKTHQLRSARVAFRERTTLVFSQLDRKGAAGSEEVARKQVKQSN